MLRGRIEAALERRFGAPVSLAAVDRLSGLSVRPLVQLTELRIAQPAWAGPGDLANVRQVRARVSVWRFITGRPAIEGVTVEGAMLNLVRDSTGRANWEGREKGEGGGGLGLEGLAIRDSRLTLRDVKRHVRLAADLRAGPRGLRVAGDGTHRGRPMRLAFTGGAVQPGPWPFRLTFASPLLRFTAEGRADRAVDLGAFRARVRAQAADARILDDVIEAGLPGTQPVRLTAQVRHSGRDWDIEELSGSIGRSPLTGRLAVRERGERTILTGDVDFAALDFDDLASDEDRARAAAKTAAIGPRVIPDTPIRFEKLSGLDGTVRVTARRLLSRRPSLFRSVSATFTMDRRLLTVRPLAAGLIHGRLTGSAMVDHRAGEPKLSLDLRVADGRMEDLLGGTVVQAPLSARVVLTGAGRTVRAALAASRGHVGLSARGGSIDRRYAVFGGGDLLKGLGTVLDDEAGRTRLNCVAARFSGANGRLAAGPLVVDTPVSGATGQGALDLDGETIALSFAGRSKDPGLLQSTLPIRIMGTFSQPEVRLIPLRAEGRGVLGKLGAYLEGLRVRGDTDVRAAPAVDCARLSAAALR